MLPGRAGQPTQVIVHMTLAQLRDLPGGSAAEAAWAAARATQPGWLTGPEADAAACDATVVPIVTGHLDPAALDHLTQAWLATHPPPPAAAATTSPAPGQAGPAGERDGTAGQARDAAGPDGAAGNQDGAAGKPNPANATGDPGGAASQPRDAASPTRAAAERDGAAGHASADPGADGDCRCHVGAQTRTGTGHPTPPPLSPHTRQRLRRALLGLDAGALSGPGGLAAQLRTNQGTGLRAGLAAGPLATGPLASVSLPLDVGPASETIPAHLRRAVTTRHPHCAFPGCAQPASVCEIHHITPRSRGGPTSLANLITLCVFHHKTVIHRWGWNLHLNPDGTTTATSPHGQILHSHSPPGQAA
jgi:hypothetical protein